MNSINCVRYPMRFLLCAAMTASFLAAGPATGDEDKLYKWVDEDGNVTYQDRPPPDESGKVQTFQQSLERSAGEGAGVALPDVDVTLYSIEACDACDLARELLNERGLPYTEKNAESDVEVQEELREVAGVLSVPVLVIGDEVLTGYNKALILNELEEAGFPITPGQARQAVADPGDDSPGDSGSDAMTADEVEQAARGAEENELLDEEDDLLSNQDGIFDDEQRTPDSDDVTEWEEIPEDERISVD